MKVNWQSYEDGQLPPEERRAAEEALKNDPAARAELEGLRSLRKALREASLAEPVPMDRLEGSLGTVVGRVEIPKWRLRMTYALAAAAFVALALLVANRFAQPNIVLEERRAFETFDQARTWASARSKVAIPDFGAWGTYPLDSVHAGPGWACFDFLYDGKVVHVGMAKGNPVEEGCHVVETGNGDILVNNASKWASFSHDGLVYVVKGGSPEDNVSVAQSMLVAVRKSAGKFLQGV